MTADGGGFRVEPDTGSPDIGISPVPPVDTGWLARGMFDANLVSAPEIEITRCSAADFPIVLSLIDQEFVFSRDRTLSLAARFPHVVAPDERHNIVIATLGGLVVGAIVQRPFLWVDGGAVFRGAMVGMVYAHPGFRNRGVCRLMLDRIADDLRHRGVVDFAALWTTVPAVYQGAGWYPSDIGVFGRCAAAIGGMPATGIREFAATEAPLDRIEALREASTPMRVVRSRTAYGAVPLPAERVGIIIDDRDTAYALVGRFGDTAVIYELVGDPAGFDGIWAWLAGSAGRILVNDRLGSASQAWLSTHTPIDWQPQSLSMWLPLRGGPETLPFDCWSIPYFDRI